MPKTILSVLITTVLLSFSQPAQATPNEDLARAIAEGKSLLAEQALMAGADPNTAVSLGNYVSSTNVLLWAIKFKNYKLMALALEKGANPYIRGIINYSEGMGALEYAYKNKDAELVAFLLSKGVKIKEHEMAALISTYTPDEIASIIKTQKPDEKALGTGITTALDSDKPEILKLLLDILPLKKVESKPLTKAMKNAIYFGYLDTLQLVVPQLSWSQIDPDTLLEACTDAGSQGELPVAELLIKQWNKEPKAAGCFGNMLGGALKEGHTDIFNKVWARIGMAALPQNQFADWFSAAAEMGQNESLQWLIKNYGKNKLTQPLLFTSMVNALGGYCHTETLSRCQKTWQLLLDNGLNLNATDAKGQTFLHMVAQSYDAEDKVKWLLNKGANRKLLDKKGRNALYYAKELGNPAVLKQLQ